MFTRASEFAGPRRGRVGWGLVGFFHRSWFFGEGRPLAPEHGFRDPVGGRVRPIRFCGGGRLTSGPRGPRRGAATAGLGVGGGHLGTGRPVPAGVRDLDAEGVADDVERRRKSLPGTRPWVAAFAASSATMCSAGCNGRPQLRSCSCARRRARRAPRGVGDSRTLKLRMTAVPCHVRDSKNDAVGPCLTLIPAAWAAFVSQA